MAVGKELQEAEAEFNRLMERAKYFYERGETKLGKGAIDKANESTEKVVALYKKRMELRHNLLMLQDKRPQG